MRKEIKYILDLQEFNKIRNVLDKTMQKDIHSDCTGEYIVRTVYFENYLHETINNKKMNLNNISKYRIRMYQNNDRFLSLERKTNCNGIIKKESEIIDKELVEKLLKGEFYDLLDKSTILKNALYLQMAIKQYRAFIIVEYTRLAYMDSKSNVRITIDRNIKSSINCEKFFEKDIQGISSNEMVLEVKYSQYMPEYIKDILKILDKQQKANSKYINETMKYGI